MGVTPQEEHEWLHQLVGEWTYEMEMPTEPGGPPVKHTGTWTGRSLGGVWVLCEGRNEFPTAGDASLMTLGYDPAKGRYQGTFIASMMTNLWVYEGNRDASGTKLELETEGPSFTGDGATAPYVDTVEFDGPDRWILSSRTRGADGEWQEFMRMEYNRVT